MLHRAHYDYTNPSGIVPSTVPYLNVHLQLFLLQVTKKFSTPCHVERRTEVQVLHAPHHFVGHACNKGKDKLRLWSQGFICYFFWCLLACLFVWTLCGIVPEFMKIEAFIFGQIFFLCPWLDFGLVWNFFPFPFFPFPTNENLSSSSPLDGVPSLVFHLISSCTKSDRKRSQSGSFSITFAKSW